MKQVVSDNVQKSLVFILLHCYFDSHEVCFFSAEMNRQHYALYVHNCRLVLLLRREPGSGVDMNSLRPGEWRWKLPEVCDKKWHHYAISMNFPQAELCIDGKRFIESKHNPEVLDEWPLHATKHVHFTKLVVGACWLGRKLRLYFILFITTCFPHHSSLIFKCFL